MLSPRAMILRAPGTNCDHETAYAFERAGAVSRRVHLRVLVQKPKLVNDFQILCIPGGFCYVSWCFCVMLKFHRICCSTLR